MLAPAVALVAAVVVVLGGGGLGSLPALRQVLSGPQISPVEATAIAASRNTTTDAGNVLADTIDLPDAAGVRRPAGGGDSGRPSRPGGNRPSTNGNQRPGSRPNPATPARPVPPGNPNPPSQPTPGPTPTPAPGPVRQVGDTDKKVTKDVPVVGPTSGEVIDLVVDTAEDLIPPRR